MAIDPRTPVLIGAGQFTHRGAPGACPSPLEMMRLVLNEAAEDAGLSASSLTALDGVSVVGFTVDAPGSASQLPVPRLKNPPKALAAALGAEPHTELYTHMGGNTPQALVNHFAEEIAENRNDFVALAGVEFLGALMKRFKTGVGFDDWRDPLPDAPEPARFGDPRDGCTPQEAAHGLSFPVNVYPLFENAWRTQLGRSFEAHQAALGDLFSPFTTVAAKNPHAWFPVERSAEEIATVTDKNRMVGFPYPKFMNAIIEVDMAAGVLMASYERAKALGVSNERLVFLHGCSDAHELWNPLDRQNYYSSPAIRIAGERALDMAGVSIDELAFFDIYSCFPIAVQLACQELGLPIDDPRGLTLTGGLPYMGGPGNNYSMHGIAEALHRCRTEPQAYGLVTANGWFLTKHAMGVYSARPTIGAWRRESPKAYQAIIDAAEHPDIAQTPAGPATIETFTVIHSRDGYHLAIIIGRDENGRRFVANTPKDEAIYAALEASDPIGRSGRVHQDDKRRNIFVLDDAG